MSSTASVSISGVSLLLLVGIIQVLGFPRYQDPHDDPAYQSFAFNLEVEKQDAQMNINTSMDILINDLNNINLPEFDVINQSLTECFEQFKIDYPDARADCMGYISLDVQKTISDSKYQLDACSNLTRSHDLIPNLLEIALKRVQFISDVVVKILAEALKCVMQYPTNPGMKYKCFMRVRAMYDPEWNNATDLTQQANYQISGGDLLYGAEVKNCQNAENFTFTGKCNSIKNEIVSSCLPITTTTTSTTTTPTNTTTTTAPQPALD